MSKRVTYALAGLLALAAGAAQAQSASAQGSYTGQDRTGYYYDACKRDQTQRGTVGAVLGGGAGAVIGSNVAARNARTEGALLGGLLGAIAGGVVGNKSAACVSPSQYSGQYAPPPPAAAPPPRAESRYYDRDAYAASSQAREDAYARDGQRLRVAQGPADADGCTLAESPIYMPDGRTQTRFVRVCRDATGRYAVVD